MNPNLLIMLPIIGMILLISLSPPVSSADPAKADSQPPPTATEGRAYFPGVNPYGLPYPYPSENGYNPYPFYVPARLGGFNGPGNLASSCAYAYPNRRYSCYGLGRR